jgi:signal transduction histidine kinase
VRVPIRLKVLLVLSFIVLSSLGVYLVLAVRLMERDQLAYAQDLNQNMASTLSAQVRAHVDAQEAKLALFADLMAAADPKARAGLVDRFMASDPSILRLVFYARGSGPELAPVVERLAEERLQKLELSPGDLALVDREAPVRFGVAKEPLTVQNRSLPPSAPIVTFVLVDRTQTPARYAAAADLSPDRLTQIFASRSIYTAALVDGDGVVIAHPDGAKTVKKEKLSELPPVKAALTARGALGGAIAYASEQKPMLGAFGHVGAARLHVISQIERTAALAGAEQLVRLSVRFGIAVVFAAIFVSVFFARFLSTPIRRLQAATEELARGRYDVDPGVRSNDEIGDLARDFRAMAQRIRQAQDHLVQSEKMAAFGQLSAGITHEVRNPLAAIAGYAELGLATLDDPAEVKNAFEGISSATQRCLEILNNLLTFARPGEGERGPVNVNAVVEDALKIVAPQLRKGRVQVETKLAPLPSVIGSGKQLQQVILNLALNAQQAMEKGGKLSVTTRASGDGVEIEVQDDGPGIPAEIQARIFEPFFTTKPAGKGSGLGLSISYGIVQAHGGELRVESSPGHGTRFLIQLPVSAAAATLPHG